MSLNFNRPNSYSSYSYNNYKIQLEDASGNVVGAYSDSTDPQTFTFGATKAGTYYAKIASYYTYSAPSADQYSLTASFAAGSAAGFESESNNTQATANAVTLDAPITGQIASVSDVDYYSFTIGSAGTVSLNFNRPNSYSSVSG